MHVFHPLLGDLDDYPRCLAGGIWILRGLESLILICRDVYSGRVSGTFGSCWPRNFHGCIKHTEYDSVALDTLRSSRVGQKTGSRQGFSMG